MSKQGEKRIARRLGGRRHGLSGALYFAKGDGDDELLLWDHKETGAGSYRVRLKDLEKIANEASGEGKYPALIVEFTGEDVDELCPREWLVIPLIWYEDLKEAGNAGEGG